MFTENISSLKSLELGQIDSISHIFIIFHIFNEQQQQTLVHELCYTTLEVSLEVLSSH